VDIKKSKFKAIDLYSGVGGWTLGLQLAGVKVVASYERWGPAIETHEANFDSEVFKQDIRSLNLDSLPQNIDFVVGSPPCTNFSYSNRGGSGDIADGLKDMAAFLEVVRAVKPKFWAMENVPRVKNILENILENDPYFKEFEPFFNYIEVVNCKDFGLPQNRKRMIAGNFPFRLFESYKSICGETTMEASMESLRGSEINDFLYGYSQACESTSGLQNEESLTSEEVRMNSEAKSYHPVYNKMSFPDKLNRPSRTITSTCTRVSRESIVLSNECGEFRRLNLRERACLQGFPVSFEFLGNSYSDQLKMVGNAIPPPLTYHIASSFLSVDKASLKSLPSLNYTHKPVTGITKTFSPNAKKKSYPVKRSFRFCVPSLRFGSGVRFQLSNSFVKGSVRWNMDFYYGSSKDIRIFRLNEFGFYLVSMLRSPKLEKKLAQLKIYCESIDSEQIQLAWAHREKDSQGPFSVADKLGQAAVDIKKIIETKSFEMNFNDLFSEFISIANDQNRQLSGVSKLRNYFSDICAGTIVGFTFNKSR